MKTFAAILVLAATLAGCGGDRRPSSFEPTTTAKTALWCDILWPNGSCAHWAPSPPWGADAYAGSYPWIDCGGDTNAYNGETVIFSDINFNGYCFYRQNPSAGTTLWSDVLGDMDRTNPTYHIRSMKVRINQVILFDYINRTGPIRTAYGDADVYDLSSFNASSMIQYD
jgi:hypothetical protein